MGSGYYRPAQQLEAQQQKKRAIIDQKAMRKKSQKYAKIIII